MDYYTLLSPSSLLPSPFSLSSHRGTLSVVRLLRRPSRVRIQAHVRDSRVPSPVCSFGVSCSAPRALLGLAVMPPARFDDRKRTSVGRPVVKLLVSMCSTMCLALSSAKETRTDVSCAAYAVAAPLPVASRRLVCVLLVRIAGAIV